MHKKLLFIFVISSLIASSQTKKRTYTQHEIGVFGGASYYLGDINPRKHFIFSKPAFGVLYRVAMTYRYAFRFGFNYGSVWGNDNKSGEANQIERNLHFSSDIYEGHALYEFNFLDYRIGKDKYYFSVFLFGGIGGYYMNPRADLGYGTVNLSELNTEAQGKSYSKYQICLPFGIGIKWNATDIFGFGFEWGPRKLFTDYLDDVSSTFPLSGSGNNAHSFGTGDPGTIRGNPRSKDWYFYYGFTLQMRLPSKNRECHGMGLN
ncbi:MAG: hypothetical protein IPM51_13930 [Sphingobacteriaceae bacterium]|nr:hypothetical protein [Sphingobacteriaceae bacterium]